MRILFEAGLWTRAERLLEGCRSKGLKIATAESCTGGLIAGLLTDVPGSSDVVDRGFIVYSNEAKSECLGVGLDLIERYGAVSAEVAAAMALGALNNSRADLSIAVTGIAGPTGATQLKPVGLVHFGCGSRARPVVAMERRFGDIGRSEIRMAAVGMALEMLEGALLEV